MTAEYLKEHWESMAKPVVHPEEFQGICSTCGDPIWKDKDGTLSHYGGYPDHPANQF